MDVGLNTQNLAAILLVIFLSALNIFGVRTGAAVQNVFTVAKTAALLGLVLLGVFVGRNAQAIACLLYTSDRDDHRRRPGEVADIDCRR